MYKQPELVKPQAEMSVVLGGDIARLREATRKQKQ